MSSSITLDEKFEALMNSYQTVISTNDEVRHINEELKNRNAYLRKQLEQSMKLKQKALESPSSSNPKDLSEEVESQHSEYEIEATPRGTPCKEGRAPTNFNDFRVELPEFEGKLDLDEFLEWLHTVERIFEYKEVPGDKKVKLVALRLRKYACLWWTNLCNKRIRERKPKI